jgi:hypothetical protein
LKKQLVLSSLSITALWLLSLGEIVLGNPSGGGRTFIWEAEAVQIMIFAAAAILAALIGWFWIRRFHLKTKQPAAS